MKRFKCRVVFSQYQTIEVEAQDWIEAETKAKELFNFDHSDDGDLEVYDTTEVTTEEDPAYAAIDRAWAQTAEDLRETS